VIARRKIGERGVAIGCQRLRVKEHVLAAGIGANETIAAVQADGLDGALHRFIPFDFWSVGGAGLPVGLNASDVYSRIAAFALTLKATCERA
jgi:hypothetical protein